MKWKVYLDKKFVCEIPDNLNAERTNTMIKAYMFNDEYDWSTFVVEKVLDDFGVEVE